MLKLKQFIQPNIHVNILAVSGTNFNFRKPDLIVEVLLVSLGPLSSFNKWI